MHKLNDQFKVLNVKLDLIIEALGLNDDEDDEEGVIYEDDEDEEEGEDDEEVEEGEEVEEVLSLDPVAPDAAPKKASKKA